MSQQEPTQNRGEEQKGKDQNRDPKNVGRNNISKESQKPRAKDDNSAPQDDQVG